MDHALAALSRWGMLALAGYAAIGGAVTLVGWWGGWPRLTDWFGTGIAMFANTALAAVCTGAALIVTMVRRPWSALVVGALGAVVAVLGAATLVQHVAGVDLGIDRLLATPRWGQKAAVAPGRMGPPASTAFTMLGVALVLLATRSARARGFAPGLGLVVCFISALSLAGYALRADPLYAVAKYTGISLQTATILLALALGLVIGVTDREPMRTLAARSAAGMLARRSLPFIVGVPLCLGYLEVRGQRAGWFDTAMGTSLLIMAVAGTFCGLLYWWIRGMNRYEAALRRSEQAESVRRLELEELMQVVQHRNEQLETLVNRAPLGVYLVDADFRIARVNPVALPYFADVPGGVLGRDFEEVCHLLWDDTQANAMAAIFRHTLATGEPHVDRESEQYRVDRGETRHYEWNLDRILLPEGRYGLVCYFRDVTAMVESRAEREALLESERAARMEADRAGRSKDEFLAVLSHELRTPLNAIIGWSQILKRGIATPETILHSVEVIERNAKAQAQLISDLLDMTRIASAKLRLEMGRVDVAKALDAALQSIRPAAEAKGVRLTMAPAREPLAVRGDPQRIAQILGNVLSNAVKFTPKGGEVLVSAAAADDAVELEVRDTGEGIDPDFLPHLFERFRQADATTTRRYGGLGLGLALVKQLTELHGGTVEARSEGKGRGATFVIRLPLDGSRAGAPSRSRSDRCDHVDLEGIEMLVVDDDVDTLEMLRRIFVECRAAVTVAPGADAAIGALGQRSFDVLVSDIGMPVRDGYEFIRDVRQRELAIPAVALTAFTRPEDREKALLAGYQAHVGKPVDPSALLHTVARLVGRLAG